MNQKKSKAIRRYVRSLGHTIADLPRPRTGVIHETDPVTRAEYSYDLPMTARYKATSFQRTVAVAKRTLRGVRTAVINARADLNFAAQS